MHAKYSQKFVGGLVMKLPPQKLYPQGFGGAPQRLGGGGGGAGATRRVTEVVCVRPPPTPVIVRTMGADALPPAVTESTDELLAGLGLNDALAPAGSPSTLRLTGALNPSTGSMLIV